MLAKRIGHDGSSSLKVQPGTIVGRNCRIPIGLPPGRTTTGAGNGNGKILKDIMIAAPARKLRGRVIGIYGILGCFNLGPGFGRSSRSMISQFSLALLFWLTLLVFGMP